MGLTSSRVHSDLDVHPGIALAMGGPLVLIQSHCLNEPYVYEAY